MPLPERTPKCAVKPDCNERISASNLKNPSITKVLILCYSSNGHTEKMAEAGQMTLDDVTGGAPCGATMIAGGDGSRQPSENELDGARYQGRKIAETAGKLHG